MPYLQTRKYLWCLRSTGKKSYHLDKSQGGKVMRKSVELQVKMIDPKHQSDQTIGKVTLSLHELQEGEPTRVRLTVEGSKLGGAVTLDVSARFVAGGDGDDNESAISDTSYQNDIITHTLTTEEIDSSRNRPATSRRHSLLSSSLGLVKNDSTSKSYYSYRIASCSTEPISASSFAAHESVCDCTQRMMDAQREACQLKVQLEECQTELRLLKSTLETNYGLIREEVSKEFEVRLQQKLNELHSTRIESPQQSASATSTPRSFILDLPEVPLVSAAQSIPSAQFNQVLCSARSTDSAISHDSLSYSPRKGESASDDITDQTALRRVSSGYLSEESEDSKQLAKAPMSRDQPSESIHRDSSEHVVDILRQENSSLSQQLGRSHKKLQSHEETIAALTNRLAQFERSNTGLEAMVARLTNQIVVQNLASSPMSSPSNGFPPHHGFTSENPDKKDGTQISRTEELVMDESSTMRSLLQNVAQLVDCVRDFLQALRLKFIPMPDESRWLALEDCIANLSSYSIVSEGQTIPNPRLGIFAENATSKLTEGCNFIVAASTQLQAFLEMIHLEYSDASPKYSILGPNDVEYKDMSQQLAIAKLDYAMIMQENEDLQRSYRKLEKKMCDQKLLLADLQAQLDDKSSENEQLHKSIAAFAQFTSKSLPSMQSRSYFNR